jgi:membrane-associated phospholipid phosphatase
MTQEAAVHRPARATCARGWLDQRGLFFAIAFALPSLFLGLLASNYDTFFFDRVLSAIPRELGPSFRPIADIPNEGNGMIALGALFAVVLLLAWRRHYDTLAMVILIAASRPLLQIPKDLVGRPRPSGDFAILDAVRDSSFPSGHVMSATVFVGLWFVLAPELVPRRFVTPVRWAAAAVIVLFMIARMWAGVHWMSDTVGGVLWASTLLAIGLAIRPALARLLGSGVRREVSAASS